MTDWPVTILRMVSIWKGASQLTPRILDFLPFEIPGVEPARGRGRHGGLEIGVVVK
jgi:hypothetical protein